MLAGLFHKCKDRHAHASSSVTYGILARSLVTLFENFNAVRIKEAREIERQQAPEPFKSKSSIRPRRLGILPDPFLRPTYA